MLNPPGPTVRPRPYLEWMSTSSVSAMLSQAVTVSVSSSNFVTFRRSASTNPLSRSMREAASHQGPSSSSLAQARPTYCTSRLPLALSDMAITAPSHSGSRASS
ncbi:unnamed protein product, partial [Heterosigma akashiwo]